MTTDLGDGHGIAQAFLRSLKPINWGEISCEPFTSYLIRIKPLLPGWPEDVIEQWIYRHYQCAITDYGWLGLQGLRFDQQSWPTQSILNLVDSWTGYGLVENHSACFTNSVDVQQSWLGARMIRDGTWPMPIIVLANGEGIRRPDHLELAMPYHLLEGHHRLGYLKALVMSERWTTHDVHDLWIATAIPSGILDYWPMNG